LGLVATIQARRDFVPGKKQEHQRAAPEWRRPKPLMIPLVSVLSPSILGLPDQVEGLLILSQSLVNSQEAATLQPLADAAVAAQVTATQEMLMAV
jgi:hypothetical protein